MTDQEKQQRHQELTELREKMEAYMSQQGADQADFARKTGVSESTISLLYRGKFDAMNNRNNLIITSNVIKKVRDFFVTDETIWETQNYKTSLNLFNDAKYEKIQGILDGPKGSGKSFAAEDFVRKNPGESFLFTCDRDMGIMDFTHQMADVIGVSISGSRYQVRQRVSASLWKMTDPVLFFDEMEEAKTDLIYSTIKGLYDHKHLYRHVGMVLIGANEYLDQLHRKSERKDPKSFPQMISRFASNHKKLQLLTLKECAWICETYYGITDPELSDSFYYESQQDYRRLERSIKSYFNNLKLRNHGSNRAA